MKKFGFWIVPVACLLLMGQAAPKPSASQPATQPVKVVWPLERAYDGMPENLKPIASESTLKRQARAEWLKANVYGHKLGPWELAGTLADVSLVKVEGVSKVQVMMQYPTMFFGERKICIVTSVLADVPVDDALGWKRGMNITIKGNVVLAALPASDGSEPSPEIRMVDGVATQKPGDKPSPTTKPASPARAGRAGR